MRKKNNVCLEEGGGGGRRKMHNWKRGGGTAGEGEEFPPSPLMPSYSSLLFLRSAVSNLLF